MIVAHNFCRHGAIADQIAKCGDYNAEVIAASISELFLFGLYPTLNIDGSRIPLSGIGYSPDAQSYFGVIRNSGADGSEVIQEIPFHPSRLEFVSP